MKKQDLGLDDFTKEELEDIMEISNELINMPERERKVIFKAIEIYNGTKYGY